MSLGVAEFGLTSSTFEGTGFWQKVFSVTACTCGLCLGLLVRMWTFYLYFWQPRRSALKGGRVDTPTVLWHCTQAVLGLG